MYNGECLIREFGNTGLRFCREANGILWETQRNVVVTRMERLETHRVPKARNGNISFTEGKICRW